MLTFKFNRYLGIVGILFGLASSGCSSPERKLEDAIIDATENGYNHSHENDRLIHKLARQYVHALLSNRMDYDMAALAKKSLEAGCREPFVHYLWIRQRYSSVELGSEELAREAASVSDELQQTPYPSFLRAFAASRALDLWDKTFVDREKQTRRRLIDRTWDETLDAIADPKVPESVARWLGYLLDSYYQYSKSNRVSIGERIDGAFAKRFGDCASIHFLKAKRAITRAWEARGGEYAAEPTEAAKKACEKEFAVAEQELQQAWKMDSTDPQIATAMITVCSALNHDQAEMEAWFQRAIGTGRDGYPACAAKSKYISARWHGSLAEQLQFAKQCLDHPEWGDRTPLILWYAHVNHQKYNELAPDYFGRPEVWADIKESFTAYFKKVPYDEVLHTRFAYHAWLVKDWALLKSQLKEANPAVADLERIGGRKVFDQMVADAETPPPEPTGPASNKSPDGLK